MADHYKDQLEGRREGEEAAIADVREKLKRKMAEAEKSSGILMVISRGSGV